MKKILCIFAAFFVAIFTFAHDLTPSQIETLQKSVLDKLNEFQYHIQIAADKTVNQTTRNNHRDLFLCLFMNKGREYSVYDPDKGRNVPRSAAKMQTINARTHNIGTQRVINYIDKLVANKMSYVKITQADVVRLDNIEKTSNGKYEAMAYICQKFVRYNGDGKVVYADITSKRIKIYIDSQEIRTPSGTKVVWDVKLGDVVVEDVQKI